MHALKMAVFDFDGTLVDSVPAIARGIQLANEEIGNAPSRVRLWQVASIIITTSRR